MAPPHPVLLDIAAERPPRAVDDAEGLLASAYDHRMGGLLWSAVDRGEVALPPDAARELARRDLWTQSHHRKLWTTAHHVTACLAEIGAAAALFKGVAAEHRWYDRPGERPCNDLDVLLRPSDVARIEDVVNAIAPGHGIPSDVFDLFARGVLDSLDVRAGGIDVDIHADPLKVEIPSRQRERFWQRTTFLTAPDGHEVRTVDAEASLVQLVLHLNKDRFARLIGFVDVAKLLRDDLDWEVVAELLHREGLQDAAVAALYTVTTRLELDPPPLPAPSGWRPRLWHALWPADSMLAGRAGLVTLQHRQLWLPWLARGRRAETVRWWLRRRAFPPSELLDYQLPDTRGPYVWRLLAGRTRRFRERRLEARSIT